MVSAEPGRDRGDMKLLTIGGPLFLLAYGLLRLVDGLDGSHGPGWAWNVGHTCFLIAFLMFGALVWKLRDVSVVAAIAGLVGSSAFVWVILGDLFQDLPGLPDVLMIAGPLLFQLGVLALLTLLAVRHLMPMWSPALVLVGLVLFVVDLDLLPLGALLLLVGLAPLAVRRLDATAYTS